MKKGDVEKAIHHWGEVVRIDDHDAKGHHNLAFALDKAGQPQEAKKHMLKALDIMPDFTEAHHHLSILLREEGDLEGAIRHARRALDINPDYAEAHITLGEILRDQGSFTEALEALRRGHNLGSRRSDWDIPSAQLIRNAERLVELDSKLAAVLKGSPPADNAERLELASLCQHPGKRLYAAAARLSAEAFAADPMVASDLQQQYRYNAACAAALAGCGKSKDDPALDDKTRARWRKQSLDWLRDDLKLWSRQIDGNEPPQNDRTGQSLKHWLSDPDLAGVRDPDAIAKLPTGEQEDWRRLWAEVERLVKLAQDKQ